MFRLTWLSGLMVVACAVPQTYKDQGTVCVAPADGVNQNVQVTYTHECLAGTDRNVTMECTAEVVDGALQINGKIRYTSPWSGTTDCVEYSTSCVVEGGLPESGEWTVEYGEKDSELIVPSTRSLCIDPLQGEVAESSACRC